MSKSLEAVGVQIENVRREADQRAGSALTAVNKVEAVNEKRFAEREQLAGAVAQLEVQLEALRRESAIINTSNQLAIDKAEASNEKRFASVNEFRGQLSDQATQFMPRELAESKINEATTNLAARLASLEKALVDIRSWRDMQTGQSTGVSTSIGWIVAAIGVVGTVLTIVIVMSNVLTGT